MLANRRMSAVYIKELLLEAQEHEFNFCANLNVIEDM